MTVISIFAVITFTANMGINLYKAIKDSSMDNLNAAAGWFCALLWVVISL